MAAEQANTATSVGNQLLKMTLCPYRRSIDVSPAFFISPELKQRRHTNWFLLNIYKNFLASVAQQLDYCGILVPFGSPEDREWTRYLVS